jgi:cytochrome c-type biogenesis protein CcmH/NrfF
MDWFWLGPLPATTFMLWLMLGLFLVTGGAWLLSRATDSRRKRRRRADEARFQQREQGADDGLDERERERQRRGSLRGR